MLEEQIKKEIEILNKSKDFGLGVEIVSKQWQDYMKYVCELVSLDGYWLEFGVASGGSIKFIANQPKCHKIYGFDCFTGLPEKWKNLSKGHFNLDGKPPTIDNAKIEFIVGMIEETLPEFVKRMDKPAAFIHIDTDLYSTCSTILSCLKEKIITGTIIALDDVHNWKECLDGEMTALIESEIKYEWIAHTQHVQAAIKVIND